MLQRKVAYRWLMSWSYGDLHERSVLDERQIQRDKAEGRALLEKRIDRQIDRALDEIRKGRWRGWVREDKTG